MEHLDSGAQRQELEVHAAGSVGPETRTSQLVLRADVGATEQGSCQKVQSFQGIVSQW